MIIPIHWVGLMASLGAIVLAVSFHRLQRSPLVGAGLGILSGIFGSAIVMAPLGFCPFEPERTAADRLLGLGLMSVGTAVVIWPLVSWVHRRYRQRQGLWQPPPIQKGTFRGWMAPWLFLLPTLGILALFLYYPALDTVRLSTQLTFVGAPRSRFVCVDNFTQLMGDSDYLRSVGITFGISAAIIVIGLTSSLLIATLVYQPIQGASLYRTLLIWPYAISPAVAGIIFFILFNPIAGVINFVLDSLFDISPRWLSEPWLAPWVVIVASVWKQMGYNILFYLAGLQNIPSDLLEAASIDGASAWRRFVSITIPLLSPITFFLIVTNMTYAFFDIFATIDLLTGGGPLDATSVLIYRIYEVGVSSGNLGNAAAQSIILFLMVVGLTIIQFQTERKTVTYGG